MITETVKNLLYSLKNSDDIHYYEGDLEEYIEAATTLDLECDFVRCKKNRCIDFMAWNAEKPEKAAQIRLICPDEEA